MYFIAWEEARGCRRGEGRQFHSTVLMADRGDTVGSCKQGVHKNDRDGNLEVGQSK